MAAMTTRRPNATPEQKRRSIEEAKAVAHLIDTTPRCDPELSALAELTEGDSQTLYNVGYLLGKLSTMEKITPEDKEAFERLVSQLKYETRYKRLHLLEQMYKLALEALHQLQYSMQGGESSDLAVSAAQFRLLVKDYANLTREEYGEKTAEALTATQVNIQRVIIYPPEKRNEDFIDGEVISESGNHG